MANCRLEFLLQCSIYKHDNTSAEKVLSCSFSPFLSLFLFLGRLSFLWNLDHNLVNWQSVIVLVYTVTVDWWSNPKHTAHFGAPRRSFDNCCQPNQLTHLINITGIHFSAKGVFQLYGWINVEWIDGWMDGCWLGLAL